MNVSVVIPTYNRKPILEKCLKALERQILNKNISNYEIVVVDDGSTDGTTSWIKNNSKKLEKIPLKLHIWFIALYKLYFWHPS